MGACPLCGYQMIFWGLEIKRARSNGLLVGGKIPTKEQVLAHFFQKSKRHKSWQRGDGPRQPNLR